MARRKGARKRDPRIGNLPLPATFRDRIEPLLGPETDALINSLEAPAPTSIRLNPFKPLHPEAESVPWCMLGRYLPERPAFTLDPLLHAGAYYVQEASSMLVEQAVCAAGADHRELLALDLCAAPGGKTTHLLSLLLPGSMLVANEPDAVRRQVLAENCWKLGAPNVMITGSDPSDLRSLPACFDLILVDAPCSGEGLFRKDPFAREQWSVKLVEQCAATQSRIIAHAWEALAPGGVMLYSTCTWEQVENEEQAASLVRLGAEPIELPMDPSWGVQRVEMHGAVGYRCYPHRVRGEGFFLAAMRKPGEWRIRSAVSSTASASLALPWLRKDAGMELLEQEHVLFARPARWSAELNRINGAMSITSPGIPVAERRGDRWLPHAAAALSTLLDPSEAQVLDLDRTQALSYLRGEALAAEDAHGAALIRHAGLPLGWVQGAGRRWNNRWPAPWRIRQLRSEAPPVSWSEE